MAYQQIFAKYYDTFYQLKNYRQECEFIDSQIRPHFPDKNTTSILELACGTGNHALILSKLGYSITATDLSSDMIEVAKSKSQALSTRLNFKVMDMTKF